MAFPTIQELLESGVHFGHQTRRWNPKMKKFIFAERNGIHIIDLKKTLNHLKKASDKVRDITAKGGTILFVGTKRQLKDIIRDEAERCGMFYVNERWLGGMMTNFQTIKKNIRRLRELERMRDEGEFELRAKKEGLSLERELVKLKKTLEGIKMLADIPDAMFVVDAQKEKIAVAEANKLGIPLIALIDTNADPEKITFPVAGNDDAIRSVKTITQAISDAVLEGKSQFDEEFARKKVEQREREAPVETVQRGEREQPRRGRSRRRPKRKRTVEEATPRPAAAAAERPGGRVEPAAGEKRFEKRVERRVEQREEKREERKPAEVVAKPGTDAKKEAVKEDKPQPAKAAEPGKEKKEAAPARMKAAEGGRTTEQPQRPTRSKPGKAAGSTKSSAGKDSGEKKE